MTDSSRERLAYWTYRSLAAISGALPTAPGRRLAQAIGTLAYRTASGSRGVVARNQSMILGRPSDDPLVQSAAREAFRLYARYWYDTFDLLDWDDDAVRTAFRGEGLEHVEDAVKRGRGAIIALPHMGNWDAAGRWMAAVGHPVVAVAERLEPERLFELFVEHRRRLGMEIVPLSEDGVGGRLGRYLANNRVVTLVADRDLGGRGVEVEMFGRTRRLPAGPALLALTADAPLLTAVVRTAPDGWRCRIGPPLTPPEDGERRERVRAMTRSLAAAFERSIAEAPPDWHVFQPAWEP